MDAELKKRIEDQLGSNNVLHRFGVFVASVVCLTGIWGALLLALLRSG